MAPNPGSETNLIHPKWTILLYLAGDNELAAHMVKALHDIDKLQLENFVEFFDPFTPFLAKGSAEVLQKPPQFLGAVKLLAQFDPSGIGVPTQRFDITAILTAMWQAKLAQLTRGSLAPSKSIFDFDIDGANSDIDPQVVRQIKEARDSVKANTLKETNTGAPETLARFVQWGISNYEAQHMMLILSGHGSGIAHNSLLSDRQFGDQSGPGDGLTVLELVRALDEGLKGHRFDIIGMDACLMSMGEVMFAVQDYADYYVGAEGFEPLAGWPYRRLLETFLPHFGKGLPVETVAHTIVDAYIDYYRPLTEFTEWSVDHAAVKLRGSNGKNKKDAVGEVVKALGELAEELLPYFREHNPPPRKKRKKAIRDAVILAHWRAQSYLNEEYIDLWDFCGQLQQELPSDKDAAPLKKACEAVMKAVDESAVCCFCGPAYQHSHGISVYFPWSSVAEDYTRLAGKLSLSTWAEFLLHYVEKTRREARSGAVSEKDACKEQIDNRREELMELKGCLTTAVVLLEDWEKSVSAQSIKFDKVERAEAQLKEFLGKNEAAFLGTEIGDKLALLKRHMKTHPATGRRPTEPEIQFATDICRSLEREIRRLRLDGIPSIQRAHTGTFILDGEKCRDCGHWTRFTGVGESRFTGVGESRFTGVGESRFTGVGESRFTGIGESRFTGIGESRFGKLVFGSSMKNPPLEGPGCQWSPNLNSLLREDSAGKKAPKSNEPEKS